jgi:RNA polymerase sigma-70 factor, ECF subfamily
MSRAVGGSTVGLREPRRRLRRQSGMSVRPDRTPSDAELLADVAEGNPDAFGALYDQHAPWLLVRLRRRTADLDVVDQVAQETFLVVWRDAGRFRGQGAVGAWIWGIAIRRLLDVQRGRAAQQRLAALLGRRRVSDAASAEEQALVTLEHGEVIRALNRLAPELQAVLQVTVLDGLSTREAAVLLGIPAGTVKTRAMRARAQLRQELA